MPTAAAERLQLLQHSKVLIEHLGTLQVKP
jgi:hypothetical protein